MLMDAAQETANLFSQIVECTIYKTMKGTGRHSFEKLHAIVTTVQENNNLIWNRYIRMMSEEKINSSVKNYSIIGYNSSLRLCQRPKNKKGRKAVKSEGQ